MGAAVDRWDGGGGLTHPTRGQRGAAARAWSSRSADRPHLNFLAVPGQAEQVDILAIKHDIDIIPLVPSFKRLWL
jgi:hypothetical protein